MAVSPKSAGLPIPQMIRPDTDAHLQLNGYFDTNRDSDSGAANANANRTTTNPWPDSCIDAVRHAYSTT